MIKLAKILSIICISNFFKFNIQAQSIQNRPDNFVDITKMIPKLLVDARYFSNQNFIGRKIPGYKKNICLITKPVALALKKVQEYLKPYQLGLKLFDCYRPQMAVDYFKTWAKDLDDTKMKQQYYPNILKKDLFVKGYIANRSGHSRGSTVDLTLVYLSSSIAPNNTLNLKELNMGTPYDFFSPKSHTAYQDISIEAKIHRLLLKSIMEQFGFINYKKEWWHYTFRKETYPNTYFNFYIE